ncbi:RDD family protein [Halalkalibacter nanhaiisediminis]|uniref:Putative RDD family membrane protein YckC n=1 Tax=Halalkalibacter nanhaiisediminis TaxID=688079 RepID=A0A562Q864_9BACI|nr:RDD family protein [Halalkalibacter nanhaiisediminis]TWI52932.1 putative RDD family membrane protein YckC [Halalkalibacter nanhaiisediminis]
MVERPAGFWIRLGATLIDGLLIAVVGLIVTTLIGISFEEGEIIQNIMNLLYALILPVVWYGYTIGKRICGVRIVKLDGSNVGFGTMLLRVIVAMFVYVITLGIGLIVTIFMVAFRKDKRGIHDMLAKTYVTYKKPDEGNPYQES